MNRRLLGNGLLLLTAMIWGTAFVFQRTGMESIGPITFNAARMALSAVVIAPLAFLTGRKEREASADEERKREGKITLVGGLCCGGCLAVASVLQQMGLVYTPAGKAGFITAMYMLLVPLIGFVFFKRKNPWLVWAAVGLGVIGMYLLCVTEAFSLSYGDTLVCFCALFFSFHILCCDYFVRFGNPVRISAVQFATAAVLSAIAAFVMEKPSVDQLAAAVIPIVYCGVVSGGIGYTLQITAQKFTDPATASLLMSMESVFAVIAGALLLHEQMSAREWCGCAVMFAAMVMVQIPALTAGRTAGTDENESERDGQG